MLRLADCHAARNLVQIDNPGLSPLVDLTICSDPHTTSDRVKVAGAGCRFHQLRAKDEARVDLQLCILPKSAEEIRSSPTAAATHLRTRLAARFAQRLGRSNFGPRSRATTSHPALHFEHFSNSLIHCAQELNTNICTPNTTACDVGPDLAPTRFVTRPMRIASEKRPRSCSEAPRCLVPPLVRREVLAPAVLRHELLQGVPVGDRLELVCTQ